MGCGISIGAQPARPLLPVLGQHTGAIAAVVAAATVRAFDASEIERLTILYVGGYNAMLNQCAVVTSAPPLAASIC